METPSNEVFLEMQEIAISIWNEYDNTYGYVDEKVNRVRGITNIQDNAMVFYRMFDWSNQLKFKSWATPSVLEYIKNNH
jgi:hypothetical protein